MSGEFRTIILDFDGTIIESVGVKDWAFRELYRDYPDHIDEIMDYHLAHNATLRFEKFEYIAKTILKQPYGEREKQKTSALFHDLVFRRIVESPFVAGARDFLDYFSRKVPLYLVSMSPDDELSEILAAKGLTDSFKRVYAGSWLKAEAIADILMREHLEKSQAVYIGDAPEDQSVSRESGIPFIGRNSGKLLDLQGGPIFDDLSGVKQYLRERVSRENALRG